MKKIVFAVLLFWNFPLSASSVPDLEAVMKNMGFQFKQAADATTANEVLPYLYELTQLTQQATQAHFPEEKAVIYREGLDLVLAELQAAEQAAATDDMAQVKIHLRQIDDLRKKYHKERRSSIWKLLFG
ncbi:cytochrome b562 [Chromatiaceae bacterium AAb-1]|nr:cytochrome b562 [Chromatiaceae bacterium AAb-1]